MRNDLEMAMGAVITNSQTCDQLQLDPNGLAGSFQLSDAETLSLISMRNDLASLMPSFINKRRRSLRRSSRRTLSALGRDGQRLLNSYISEQTPVGQLREDCRSLAEFLVGRTAEDRSTTPASAFNHDVARFERAIVATNTYSRPLGTARRAVTPIDPDTLDLDQPLQLVADATLAGFGWDFRPIQHFSPSSVGNAPLDPCTQLIFHSGTASGPAVVRILPEVVPALELIATSAGTTVGEAIAVCPRDRPAINTLSRLMSAGGIR